MVDIDKSIKSIILIIFLFVGFSSNAQEKRTYPNLKAVYQDMIKTFKLMNDTALQSFCYRLAPDEQTLAYMRTHNLNYRGIPEQLDKQHYQISAIGDTYFPALKRVRDRLMRSDLLSLLVVDQDIFKTKTINVNGVVIEGTDTDLIMKSGNKQIFYIMGEMVKINGKWSLFTRPNVDYSIKSNVD